MCVNLVQTPNTCVSGCSGLTFVSMFPFKTIFSNFGPSRAVSRDFISTNYVRKLISLSSQLYNKANASFEEVRNVKTSKNTVLIDVREPSELQETGSIPGSINIPLGEVENALKDMSSEEFKKRFGRDKPSAQTPLIFSCKAGVRSGKAQDIALKLGYTNTKSYEGGWMDWAERNNK